MHKTICFFTSILSFSLILSLFVIASFAADIETLGNLKVEGVIESSSGGFKFPDGTTWTTGSMDGLHFNMGFVVDDSNSNAGNLTNGAIKFGTGNTGEGIASQRLSGTGQNGLDFYTNFTSRLFVGNNGYIGIGTRTPDYPLTVSPANSYGHARFGDNQPTYIGSTASWIGSNIFWDSPSGSWKYGTNGFGGLIWLNGGLTFLTAPGGTAGSSAVMTTGMKLIGGKLRIGNNSDPTETLDVTGNIKASGTVSAQGIAVTTGAASGHVLTSDASGSGSWQVPLPPTKVGTLANGLSPSSTCARVYTPSAVLTVTPERSGLLNLMIQSDYNFAPRYSNQVYVGVYVSSSPTAPTCSSAFSSSVRVGWAGSMASSTFGGDIPVSYFHQQSVSAGNTYYIWVGIDGVNYDYTNQTGTLMSHKIIATLNQAGGL